MGLRKRFRDFRDWCPQPRETSRGNIVKISPVMVTAVVLAEILFLLIAPITYYALLVPKPSYGFDKEFPLTNTQVKASWPSLPTAQEIESTNVGYGEVLNNSYTGSSIVNCTVVNPIYFGSFGNATAADMPSPRYDIYLCEGNTSWSKGVDVWIQVPETYLINTSNPPPIPAQGGFLGTALPAAYVPIAAIAIIITLLAGMSYLFHKKTMYTKVAGD
jgi:hypothetical protein